MEKELHLLGIDPIQLSARDDVQLAQAFGEAAKSGGLVLAPLTGNEPIDRLISENVAKICGVKVELHPQAAEQIARSNHRLTREETVKYAQLPKGAQIFPQRGGLTPGYQVAGNNVHVIVLPADETEQINLFFSHIFPTFAQQQKQPCISHTLRIMDLSTQKIEGALSDILSHSNPCVALYPLWDETAVRISACGQDYQQTNQICLTAVKTALERLGSYVYGVDTANIEQALIQRLEKKNLKIAVAEYGTNSSAGRRLSKCTNAARRIAVHISADKNPITDELNIPQQLVDKNGLVSRQTAGAMAAAVARTQPNTIGISLTLPTAQQKSASAFLAAAYQDAVLVEEIPISKFQSISRLVQCCVSHALNLARKFVDSYPSAPKGAVSVEQVLQSTSISAAVSPELEKKGKNTVQKSSSKTKKQSLGKRILAALFPQKGESKGEKMRKIGILVCACVFCCSIGYLIHHHQQGVNAGKETEKLNDMLSQAESGHLKVDQDKLNKVHPKVLEKYKPFVALNEDTKGWVKIPDTKVSYPVVQAKDNEFYHRKNFNGDYDYYGVPYLDFECSIDVDDVSDNLIVYGHNIGNDGLMFNPVTYYKKLDFYKSHPIVSFDSIYEEAQYKVFGVFITNAQAPQDNGKVFHYQRYVDFENEQQFNEFVNEVRRRSMWDIDVDVQPGDKLLTLSTCTYDFRPDARCVVVARKVRPGEDLKVNTDAAKVNEDAYFPQAYYDAQNEKAKYGQVKGIKIEGKKEYTINVGETLQLKAVTNPANAPINTATWDSSTSAVATVDPKSGLVTAVAPGEAVITAMADDGGFAASVKVTVVSKNSLEYLGVDQENITMQVGQENRLSAIVNPEDAAVKLEWSVDANEYLELSVSRSNPKHLYLRALKGTTNGPVTITVKDTVTGKTASCAVTITEQNSLTGMQFQYDSYTMQENETKQVQVNVLPDGAVIPGNTEIQWKVRDSSIAEVAESVTVSSKGITRASNSIRGLRSGSTTLYAEVTVDGKTYTAQCAVNVSGGNVTISSIDPNPLTMNTNSSERIDVTVNPASAASQVSVSSQNGLVSASIGRVRDDTIRVEVNSSSTTGNDFILFTVNGQTIGTCAVTVGSQTPALSGVEIIPGNVTLNVGDSTTLSAKVSPEGAKIAKYSWRSDSNSIASVNPENGTVTANGEGSTTIWLEVTDEQGNRATAQATIEVKASEQQPEKITISGPSQLQVNTTGQLSVTGADISKCSWTSDSNISIDANGVVTAIAPGRASITVTGPNGGTATFSIEVVPAPDSGTEPGGGTAPANPDSPPSET